MLYYANRQRREFFVARTDLRNQNKRITTVNAQLHEANEVKAVYIGKFLSLCANYIDRMDEMRKRTVKMIKGHHDDDLLKLMRSLEQKDSDLNEFYNHFDRTFLGLFPTFVSDFNALLRPECRVVTNRDDRLNATVRIFALIRLGIDDFGKMADILYYSANTIYNYRARTKNGALGSRSDFENEVRQLGRIS